MKIKTILYTIPIFFLVNLLFLTGFSSFAQSSSLDHIIITEIQVAGEGGTTDEFVEIFNPTANKINLDGWKLYKLTKTNTTTKHILIDFIGKIGSQKYLLLTHQNYSNVSTTADFIFNNSKTIAPNNTIVLENNKGEIVDMVGYGKATVFEGVSPVNKPASAKNFSRIKIQNDFQDTNENSNDFIKNDADPQNNSYIPPLNNPPIAILSPISASSTINQEILFSAENSTDDKEIISYKWDFGDGNFDFNTTTTYSYAVAGEFIVNLTVTDAQNETGFASTTINIYEEPEITTTTPTSTEIIAKIKINEFLPNPNEDEEWVELYNLTTSTVDLTDWFLKDNTGTFPLNGDITALGFFVYEFSSSKLNNDGDIIQLFHKNGEKIDETSYTNVEKGNSIAKSLDSGNFEETTTITKNAENIITTPPTSEPANPVSQNIGTPPPSSNPAQNNNYSHLGKIIINEILPNPDGSDIENEFIELFNADTKTINLAGWQIGDESTKRYTIKNTILESGEFLTLLRSRTKIALNNTGGDSAKLYNANISLVDSVQYSEKAKNGESYSRGDEGWFWSEITSPDTKNAKQPKNEPLLIIDAPTSTEVGISVKFDLSDSTNIEDLTFEWDFGKSTSTGMFAEYIFSETGFFTVKLNAENSEGEKFEKEIEIEVLEVENFAGGFPIDWENIEITEIFPNPAGNDADEFIEIYNSADFPVDITGLKIDDEDGGSEGYILPKNSVILPNSFVVFWKEETKISLNNTGDSARLLYPDDSVIFEINYGKTIEDASFAKINNNWKWTTTPTPNTENALEIVVKTTTSRKKVKTILNLPITEIRVKVDTGDLVRTQGTVAVLPNILATQYFYIVDNSGIQVYMHSKDFPELKVGDLVEIVGEISQAYGETRIKLKGRESIKILNHTNSLAPKIVEIADINESFEGSFVQIAGEITEIKGSYMYVDDGSEEIKVYSKKGTNIDKRMYKIADLVTTNGIVGKTRGGYQILPRSQTDIIKTGVSDFSTEYKNNSETISKDSAIEKYLTATAGGLTSVIVGLFAHSKRRHFGGLFTKLAGIIRK
ncbi:MAG: lamin tail domain-containing protein [Candidatus Magasanikbacteria bacterium]|nr:lamin tail domain-containing protein [Candidatus Magasanikbacteria bacterium]